MTAANISKFKIRLGSAASTPVYADIEEVFNITNLGKQNNLVDVTSFDSPNNTMEYIAGLADGSEIGIEANFVPAAVQQQALTAAVDAGETRAFQVAYTGVSPEATWSFNAVCLQWQIEPSPTEQNRISFTVKVTGDIT